MEGVKKNKSGGMKKKKTWGGPGTDHVTSGPMRGLKNCIQWRRHPDTRTWQLYDGIGQVGPFQGKALAVRAMLS